MPALWRPMLGCARWPSRVRCRVCAALHCTTSPRRRVRHRDEATHAPRTRLCRHTGIAQTDRGRRSASGLLDKTDFSSTSGREGAPVGLYRGGGADEGERLVKRSTQAKRRLPEVSGARLKRNADGRNRNTAGRDSQRGSRARPRGALARCSIRRGVQEYHRNLTDTRKAQPLLHSSVNTRVDARILFARRLRVQSIAQRNRSTHSFIHGQHTTLVVLY